MAERVIDYFVDMIGTLQQCQTVMKHALFFVLIIYTVYRTVYVTEFVPSRKLWFITSFGPNWTPTEMSSAGHLPVLLVVRLFRRHLNAYMQNHANIL